MLGPRLQLNESRKLQEAKGVHGCRGKSDRVRSFDQKARCKLGGTFEVLRDKPNPPESNIPAHRMRPSQMERVALKEVMLRPRVAVVLEPRSSVKSIDDSFSVQ